MLKPLTQFICDTCGEVINSPEEGWIEWLDEYNKAEDKLEAWGFKIVHNDLASPLSNDHNSRCCYQYENDLRRSDNPLQDFISDNYKMANILSFIDIGPQHQKDYKGPMARDLREYTEIVRRLTLPHYEEARQYWNEALQNGFFDDQNDRTIYKVDNLKALIAAYNNK